jgi:hypothetical protein
MVERAQHDNALSEPMVPGTRWFEAVPCQPSRPVAHFANLSHPSVVEMR